MKNDFGLTEDKIRLYFNLFSNKDINGLKNIFSENIKLRDWDIDCQGINSVLRANESIFKSHSDIDIRILNLLVDKKIAFAEILITLDNIYKIKVVDIIEVDNHGKFISIRAFKG